MDYFIDPPNKKEIIKKLHDLKEDAEFREYIDKILPNWLVYACDKYSKDYPHLQANWERICQMIKVKPQKIILTQDIIFDDDHEVVKEICEIMTKNGYVVRRSGEFIVCHVCMSAIPCKEVWHLLKEKKLPVPNTWSQKCRDC